MQIFSNPDRDISNPKPAPGSYEWWYFDAISLDNKYSLVIIFYEGNPFSRRYIDAIEENENARAAGYPAISISIYRHGDPIFYSFEEVNPEDAEFSDTTPFGRVKRNTFKRESTEHDLNIYRLALDQTMPNGDRVTVAVRTPLFLINGTLFSRRLQLVGILPLTDYIMNRSHFMERDTTITTRVWSR